MWRLRSLDCFCRRQDGHFFNSRSAQRLSWLLTSLFREWELFTEVPHGDPQLEVRRFHRESSGFPLFLTNQRV